MKREKPVSPFMTFGELREKEVVNVVNGCRLGFVCDIEFDASCGRVLRLLLPPQGKYLPFFMTGDFLCIPWENVEKIGSDLILVRWCPPQVCKDETKIFTSG